MGISSHDRSSPVIDHSTEQQLQQAQHQDMEPYHHNHPWRQESKRQQPESTPESSQDEDKHVSFDTLSIREYSQVLGDHPCCTVGPPVALGWDYTESPKTTVERYEATRAPARRSRTNLRLSLDDRKEIVSDTASDRDVRRVQRRLSRERCCQTKTMQSFFGTKAAASVTE